MASSFGGTVKLTGESEYRKALSEITSNLKVLNSEMKTVTSMYDKNDQSAENLTAQNEVLNKKIEEQEKKVSLLKDALEKAKAETGDSSETTKKWQTELNNAQAELNKLNRQVETNVTTMNDAAQETKEEADAVEDFGKEADESADKALKLGDIIKANLISDAIKAGLSALADGFKAMGSAMGECLTAGAAYADNMLTLSAQTGLSTDSLEKYNAVAELTDVSLDTLTNSMAKNIKSMSSARDGSEAYAAAYSKLGVSVTDANGNLRDGETVYWETIDALKGVTDETERDALAMEIFGKSAQDLNTIIEMGSEGVAEYEAQAVSMGAVLGGESLAALGALDDQMQTFSKTTDSTKNILASGFAPAITGALEGVNALGGAFNGLLSAVISGEGVEQAMAAVTQAVTDLVGNLQAALPQVTAVASDLLNTILALLAENLPVLLDEGAKMLSTLLSGISQNLGSILSVISSVFQTLTTMILQNLPLILQMGVQILVSLISGISSMLPDLIPLCVDTVVLLSESLLDNIDLVIDAGIDLIIGLADGLIRSAPNLLEKIPILINKTVESIVANLPKILAMGVELVVKLGLGLIGAIPQLTAQIPMLILAIVGGLGKGVVDIGKVGGDLVRGLWSGISDMASWVISKIKGFGQSILNSLKSFFGIHSPSKVFQDEIGNNLALGVGEGFSDTMDEVSDEMQNAIPTEFNADINTSISGTGAGGQSSNYDMMVSAFKQALKEVNIVLDERKVGNFVTETVGRTVFA